MADGLLNGRYEIVKGIGNPNKNVTFLARDNENGAGDVVVKVLHLQSIDKWKQYDLFLREAETLKHLKHKQIPRYVDFFKVEKKKDLLLCLVQEYVAGENLEDKVKAGFRVTAVGAFKIAYAVLKILKYLHHFKPPVIHRDLNPRNLIMGNDRRIHLVDFGAVQAAGQADHIGTQTIVGTAGYMPMEQIMGRSCEATDLYALGVTLIFLLTHTDPVNLPLNGMRIDYRSAVDLPARLRDFLDIMTDPDHAMRFKTAKEALAFVDEEFGKSTPNDRDDKRARLNGGEPRPKGDWKWEADVQDFIKHVRKYDPKFYDKDFE
jgi:serine/threonine protein kinase